MKVLIRFDARPPPIACRNSHFRGNLAAGARRSRRFNFLYFKTLEHRSGVNAALRFRGSMREFVRGILISSSWIASFVRFSRFTLHASRFYLSFSHLREISKRGRRGRRGRRTFFTPPFSINRLHRQQNRKNLRSRRTSFVLVLVLVLVLEFSRCTARFIAGCGRADLSFPARQPAESNSKTTGNHGDTVPGPRVVPTRSAPPDQGAPQIRRVAANPPAAG